MDQRFDSRLLACEPFEQRLNEYVDGELTIEAQADLFAHLAVCESCRRFLDGVVALRRIVVDEPLQVPPAADEAFLQRLAAHRESVATAKRRAERRDRTRKMAPIVGRAALVTVILALVVGLWIENDIPEPSFNGRVTGEEELVNLPDTDAPHTDYGAVYVFYPGLTVEAENWVEPVAADPL